MTAGIDAARCAVFACAVFVAVAAAAHDPRSAAMQQAARDWLLRAVIR